VFFFSNCQEKTKARFHKGQLFRLFKRDDQLTGIKMIPIKTPKGTFNVWTKRAIIQKIKVLLTRWAGIDAIYESLMGIFLTKALNTSITTSCSYYSDQPNDNSLWTNERFVKKKQVRIALA
jgi:proline iminopeptidase